MSILSDPARQFKQALIDADEVSKRRGDCGLCDCVDENGCPFPSQWLTNLLEGIRAEGYLPILEVWDVTHTQKWYRFLSENAGDSQAEVE